MIALKVRIAAQALPREFGDFRTLGAFVAVRRSPIKGRHLRPHSATDNIAVP
jgi:hypothetical protein